MLTIFKATAVASLFTALFALKFGYWQRPKLLTAYFVFFWVVEFIADTYFIPPGAFGTGMAVLCFVLAGLVAAATSGVHQYEKRIGDR